MKSIFEKFFFPFLNFESIKMHPSDSGSEKIHPPTDKYISYHQSPTKNFLSNQYSLFLASPQDPFPWINIWITYTYSLTEYSVLIIIQVLFSDSRSQSTPMTSTSTPPEKPSTENPCDRHPLENILFSASLSGQFSYFL